MRHLRSYNTSTGIYVDDRGPPLTTPAARIPVPEGEGHGAKALLYGPGRGWGGGDEVGLGGGRKGTRVRAAKGIN